VAWGRFWPEEDDRVKLTDERDIAADPATVWAAILDAEVLKACVPGCESMTGNPQDGFEAVVVQKVGPVKARFTGAVTLSDMIEPQSLRISGEGKGGPAGFAKGGANVTLTPSEKGTLLAYEVEANVGGKLAQLGSRIIDGFAKKMADDFFARFQAAVEGPADPEAEAQEAAGEAAGGVEPEKKKGWFKRMIG
jgi:carbon monoxide dehydrogenase subunit G